MAHPIWQGHISFGLVSIPVSLFAAEKHKDLSFHLLDSRDKARIRYARINETTGEEVPWNEIVKGHEYKKGEFMVLHEEDFKKAAVESSQTIEIENFVNKNAIDYIYFDKPYYLAPDKKGEKGYILLREILIKQKKMGIAKVVIHTRQHLAALLVVNDVLVLNLLRFNDELVDAKEFELPGKSLKKYKITTKELQIAKQLVEAMTTSWNPKKYHDKSHDILMKIIEKKEKGLPIETKAVAKPQTGKVIDFMALLKKSVEEKKHAPKTRRKK